MAAKKRPAKTKSQQVRIVSIRKPTPVSQEDKDLTAALEGQAASMLPRLTQKITAQPTQQKTVAGLRQTRRVKLDIRGTYDSAQTTDDNRRHWAAADQLSANAANSVAVRQTLRNRARYEVGSNSYAKGIVLTLAYDMIGTGPRLQIMGEDQDQNQRIELLWRNWCRKIRFASKLRTMVMAKVVDGEAFALPITNAKLAGIQLDLRLLEADLFTSLGHDAYQINEVDGIVFDEYGNPEYYKKLKAHPGDVKGQIYELEDVPAEQVFHWFRCDRPGQMRGIPEITPALPLFAQLRRYTLSVLNASESAAEHSGVIYTDSPPDDLTVDMAPLETLETERGMLTFLPGGWKMGQMQAEQPTTLYGDFKSEIVGEMARAVNMPILLALLRAKDYNMASGRLDLQTYFKTLEVERDDLVDAAIDPLYQSWIIEASKVYALNIKTLDEAPEHEWLWTSREHTDPAYEAAATLNRRRTWRSSLAEEYARTGDDWYPAMKQIVREAKTVAAELGVTVQEALTILGLGGAPVSPGRPPGVKTGAGGTQDDKRPIAVDNTGGTDGAV